MEYKTNKCDIEKIKKNVNPSIELVFKIGDEIIFRLSDYAEIVLIKTGKDNLTILKEYLIAASNIVNEFIAK